MLDIKAEAMDPIEAARVVFDQAAAGEFYLLTQPDYVGGAMTERADVPVPPPGTAVVGPNATRSIQQ